MKKILPILVLALLVSCNATKQVPKTVNATKDKSGNLVGLANKEMFLQTPYKGWFDRNYNNYKPNENVIAEIKKHINDYTIKGFMGTWCGDSKRETPKFYKILELTGFNNNNFDLATVNRSKRTPDNLQQGLNIIKVPTFIFYKDGKEVGRFVEYPRESIEKDVLKIVSGKPYKHSYEK